MKKSSVTVTVVANMTSNYGEGMGNIATVQKVFKARHVYSIRSKESLKNAIMVSSGLYDDLETEIGDKNKGVNQKKVNKDLNASNCRALEGGYMNTQNSTYIRNSSFYVTDAISCESFVNETRFHNNLYLATNLANAKNINLQNEASKAGLMPYQYEYDKALKIYSVTIDLDMIGKDKNFENEEGYQEATNEEKAYRVNAILSAIENLSLVVKGNLDNAEPIFVVGGLSERKTHYFENVVKVKDNKLVLSDDLKDRIAKGYYVGMLKGESLDNEAEIVDVLNPISTVAFFDNIRKDVNEYYGL